MAMGILLTNRQITNIAGITWFIRHTFLFNYLQTENKYLHTENYWLQIENPFDIIRMYVLCMGLLYLLLIGLLLIVTSVIRGILCD